MAIAYRKYSGEDRRRFKRLDLNITVFYKVHEPLHIKLMVGDKEIEATILNISEGGIGLLTHYNIPTWTALFIKFNLSRMNKLGIIKTYGPMNIKGEVRSNVSLEKDEYRLGICFIDIDPKDKTTIADFVNSAMSG